MEHPITPPPDLVQKLRKEAPWGIRDAGVTRELCLIADAYRAGADQELEACCEWIPKKTPWDAEQLRAARRPKPPSLKQQALLQLDTLNADLAMHGRGCDLSQIRRALEQLND